jgi:hypothetical protein
MLVLHDDDRREYAYGPAQGLSDTKVGTFTQELYDEAKTRAGRSSARRTTGAASLPSRRRGRARYNKSAGMIRGLEKRGYAVGRNLALKRRGAARPTLASKLRRSARDNLKLLDPQ